MKRSRAALVHATRIAAPYAIYDGDGGGGGGTPPVIDASNPEVKALLDAAVAEATKGLTTNRDTILNEKKELQKQFDQMKEEWSGLDPNVVKNLVARFNTDEETKLIAEGKFDEVLDKRTGAMKKDFESKLTAAQQRAAELEEGLGQRDQKIKGLMVEGSIRQAAAELGLVPSAFEDAVTRAKSVFSVDDEGRLIARDGDGVVQMSRNGKDPLPVSEWLEAMKEAAPHWFPGPSGAGAGGGKGGGGKGHTITRSQSLDPAAYRAAKEAASKAGVDLQIVEG